VSYERFVIPANEFEMHECIGAGAAGQVYKAIWMSGGGCEVAVKRIRIDIPIHPGMGGGTTEEEV
jgi:hypothetical protein